MQIKNFCYQCLGTGQQQDGVPPFPVTCRYCDGVGYSVVDIDASDIFEKLNEIKAKQNQMQADINYIKTKVG